MKKIAQILVIGLVILSGFIFLTKNDEKDYTNNVIDSVQIKEKSEEEEIYVLIGNRSCSSCTKYKPILQQAINETDRKVYYMDTNNNKNQSFLKENNITVTPTVLVVKNNAMKRVEGSISLDETKQLLLGKYDYEGAS